MPPKKSIKIAITDDHPLAISGLQNMLHTIDDLEIVGCYENGKELLTGLKTKRPDVLLLDVELPDIKGYDLASIVCKQFPSVKIIAITSHDAPIVVKRMMQHGCMGYVLKNVRVKELVLAINTVHGGSEYITPVIHEQIMTGTPAPKNHHTARMPVLTKRESEILALIVREFTNQEIADQLFISLRTVENHRFSLLQKFDVKNSIGLVRVAIQLGLVDS